jgi:hypothetical protein
VVLLVLVKRNEKKGWIVESVERVVAVERPD